MAVWINKYISPNKYSRPQKKLYGVKKIVMHYTANNGGTARGHFNYFNKLRGRYASAHFFVDKLEALCIIPLDEIAYHANDVQKRINGVAFRGVPALVPNANYRSVGIEMCLERDGTIHPDTVKRSEDVALELCKMYGLNPEQDIVRHYDITRKICPAPWVKNPNEFYKFKKNVAQKLKGGYIPMGTSRITLKEGNNGVQVKELQNALLKLGYKLPKYGADGDFGQETLDAVKAFQHNKGLSVDGIVGKNTWKEIDLAIEALDPIIVSMNKGKKSVVKNMQLKLLELGYKLPKYGADGYFGQETEKALRGWQVASKVKVDGIYNQSDSDRMDRQILNKKAVESAKDVVEIIDKKEAVEKAKEEIKEEVKEEVKEEGNIDEIVTKAKAEIKKEIMKEVSEEINAIKKKLDEEIKSIDKDIKKCDNKVNMQDEKLAIAISSYIRLSESLKRELEVVTKSFKSLI